MPSQIQIFLSSSNNFDTPAQEVTGRVECNFANEATINAVLVIFNGRCSIRWIKSQRQRNTGEEFYFHQEINMTGTSNGGSLRLLLGMHTYNFAFPLPEQLSSSHESKTGWGSIRYTIKAVLDKSLAFKNEAVVAPNVISPLDLNYVPRIRVSGSLKKNLTSDPNTMREARNVRKKKEKTAVNIKKGMLAQINKGSIIRNSGVQIQKDAVQLVVSDKSVEEPQPARCTRARQQEKNTETTDSKSPNCTTIQRKRVKKGNITNNIKIFNDVKKQKPSRSDSSTEDELQSRTIKSKNRIEKVSEEMEENFINASTSTPIVKEPQKLVNETLIFNKPTILNT
ncbi:hypothetical protein FQA39_LY03226 [Lamprigera yunnana]|nr:hypothetical protein FQA39_LY03226 [Lamprigera yunnana]